VRELNRPLDPAWCCRSMSRPLRQIEAVFSEIGAVGPLRRRFTACAFAGKEELVATTAPISPEGSPAP